MQSPREDPVVTKADPNKSLEGAQDRMEGEGCPNHLKDDEAQTSSRVPTSGKGNSQC